MVRLGHSSISENGTINGKVGDQTGGEVTTRDYYNKAWTYVYRPLSITLAGQLVESMLNACNNNHIGYGQNDRMTLYYECLRLAKNGRITPQIIASVTKDVNCDCSSLVSLCCIASGLKVNPSFTTWGMYGELKATKSFEIKTWAVVKDSVNLEYGDIIQSDGHTAIVIQSDRTEKKEVLKEGKVTARYPAISYDKSVAGMYTVRVNSFLALRDGGSESRDILTKLYNGDIVYCYGYYTNAFLYVQFTRDNIIYTGFCHKAYLYRV